MATTDLVLFLRPAPRAHTIARLALTRPMAQAVLLGLLDAVRLLLNSGSRALPRYALVEPNTI